MEIGKPSQAMTSSQYKKARKRLGSQEAVAKLLGVARSTVERREAGKMVITKEAAIAIRALGLASKSENSKL